MDARLRALNRFGLGARPDERRTIGDPRDWLDAQLTGGPPVRPALEASESDVVARALRTTRSPARRDPEVRRQARRDLAALATRDAANVLRVRATSSRPFVERLVAFWANHLCVSSAGKGDVSALAGAYERDAIRPHVLGRFADMVLASARHPAMLLYLDNAQSVGPRSVGARTSNRGRGRPRGLNENYARELLELHTLGVNGGYTQQDVEELARILTGWRVEGLAAGSEGPLRFVFEARLHEPGSRTLLDARIPDGGVEQGEQAIAMLCRHEATAAFVCGKLVTHMVGDAPPRRAVEAIARVFRDTDGDLRAVSAALVALPGCWDDDARKFRTPQDWLVAIERALGSEPDDRSVRALRQLRHPLWAPPAPRGFVDALREWADSDALLNRGEFARARARRLGGHAPDPVSLLEVMDLERADPLRSWLGDRVVPVRDRVALALAGPAFQWR